MKLTTSWRYPHASRVRNSLPQEPIAQAHEGYRLHFLSETLNLKLHFDVTSIIPQEVSLKRDARTFFAMQIPHTFHARFLRARATCEIHFPEPDF